MFEVALLTWRAVQVWIVAASLLAWIHVATCSHRGVPLLEFVPRRRVPWGVLEIVAILLTLTAVQGLLVKVQERLFGFDLANGVSALPPDEQAVVLASFSLATLVALLVGWFLARHHAGADRADLGLRPWLPGEDWRLGLKAFVTLAVPVFLLQMVLTQFVETRHPLIELLRENPSPLFLAMSGFAAVLVAPVAEEYFFRVFLQGWLENLAAHLRGGKRFTGPDFRTLVLGARITGQYDNGSTLQPGTALQPGTGTELDTALDGQPESHGTSRAVETCQPAIWPIFVSSFLFALAHYDHGPDPIPLFVLACGLGYLYQRTHRVLPCIAVHFFVNLFTLTELTFYLYAPA